MTEDVERDRLLREGRCWHERLDEGSRQSGGAASTTVLHDWRAWLDPDGAGLFERRLAWAGLTASDAAALLTDEPNGQPPPSWWATFAWLRAAMTQPDDTPDEGDEEWLAQAEERLPDAARTVPFAPLLWPIVDAAWQRVARHPAANLLSGQAQTNARLALARRLAEVTGPALAQALADARPVGESFLLATTNAESASRSRYAGLCRCRIHDGWADVFTAFPVLPRLLSRCVDQWLGALGDLVTRLQHDASELAVTFGSARSIRVENLRMDVGDRHRDGRTVCLLTLAGASGPVSVVYKPRDIRLEHWYHGLAAWFMADPETHQPRIAVLSRIDDAHDRYGYVSFVEHRVPDPDELHEFFRKAGRLTALLHLLGASDAHFENVVVHGTSPILIDPETLFEAQLADGSAADEGADAPVSRHPAHDITTSVLRLGLLPRWRVDGRSARALDISALGSEQPRPDEPVMHLGWRAVNTDAMHWGPVRTEPSVVHSLPVPPGTANPIAEYVDDLVVGFEQGYRAALDPSNASELRERLDGARGLPRRIVPRPTLTYARLMRQALGPSALASANARALELERLARSALVADDQRVRWPMFIAEVADLERLDVPYFDHVIGSMTLRGHRMSVPSAFREDGWQRAAQRITEADEADLHWQASLIRASIASRGTRMRATNPADPRRSRTGDPISVADAIDEIVRRIEHESVDQAGHRTWLTLAPIGDGTQVQLDLMNAGFYSGSSGLLAFLGEVAAKAERASTRARARQLADEGWAGITASILDADSYDAYRRVRNLGLGFSGTGGLLRALSLPTNTVSADLRFAIHERIIEAILSGLVERDELLDVMSGAAGAIGPLTALIPRHEGAAEAVRRLADRLVNTQQASGGWVTSIAPRALTGFSHGASGFALALTQAALTLRDDRYLDAALRALAYERSQFDAGAGNWRDLRSGDHGFMVAWCHGASGIALTRSRLLELLPDHLDAPRWHEELAVALRATMTAPARSVDYLCCGNAGRAAVLDALGRLHSDGAAQARADDITAEILRADAGVLQLRLNDFTTGAAVGQASLMTGLAGVGMHLLSHARDRTLVDLLA